MKIMGLDLGSRTVGVAISDALLMTAQPVETITRKDENKLRQTLARIEELIEENDVQKIVLGYPKNMNGSVGERAQICEAMAAELKELFPDLKDVVLWDERLSTVAATRVMVDADISRKKRKKVVDMMAAVVILQNYLDSKQFKARL